MRIHTFGDSHCRAGWNSITNVACHCVGPILCYTIGTDDRRLNIRRSGVQDGDVVVFCSGEIDCRCHIQKYISETRSHESVINEIVHKYFWAIQRKVQEFSDVTVCVYNVPPTIRSFGIWKHPEFPYLGTDEERRTYVEYFNACLRKKCRDFGFVFFDIYGQCVDEDGFLDPRISDGVVHITDETIIGNFLNLLPIPRKRSVTRFNLETCSGCTRRCATCMRQTYPDREAIRAWIGRNEKMPLPVIQRVLSELWDLGYRDAVGLNQYNEPLMDDRLAEIASFAKGIGFQRVTIITNGDLLTQERARELDGLMSHITVSGYDNRDAFDEVRGWFKRTHVSLSGGQHRLSHFSPSPELQPAIDRFRPQPCFRHSRNFIVNHQGDCLMCCEEIIPMFDIGNVHRQSLADIWYGEKRQQVIRDLSQPGGRLKYAHCSICPVGKDLSRMLEVTDRAPVVSEYCECLHDHAA